MPPTDDDTVCATNGNTHSTQNGVKSSTDSSPKSPSNTEVRKDKNIDGKNSSRVKAVLKSNTDGSQQPTLPRWDFAWIGGVDKLDLERTLRLVLLHYLSPSVESSDNTTGHYRGILLYGECAEACELMLHSTT